MGLPDPLDAFSPSHYTPVKGIEVQPPSAEIEALYEQTPSQQATIREQFGNPKLPQVPEQPKDKAVTEQPQNNATRKLLTENRKELPRDKAPEELVKALKDKITALKAKTGNTTKELKTLEAHLKKAELFVSNIRVLKNQHSAEATKEAEKREKQMHKELIALDAPKLTISGKTANLAGGILLGAGAALLLLSNPVGWIVFGVGAALVIGVMLYQKHQGVDFKQSAKWVAGGVALGFGGGVGIAGSGLMGAGAAAALAAKGTAASSVLQSVGASAQANTGAFILFGLIAVGGTLWGVIELYYRRKGRKESEEIDLAKLESQANEAQTESPTAQIRSETSTTRSNTPSSIENPASDPPPLEAVVHLNSEETEATEPAPQKQQSVGLPRDAPTLVSHATEAEKSASPNRQQSPDLQNPVSDPNLAAVNQPGSQPSISPSVPSSIPKKTREESVDFTSFKKKNKRTRNALGEATPVRKKNPLRYDPNIFVNKPTIESSEPVTPPSSPAPGTPLKPPLTLSEARRLAAEKEHPEQERQKNPGG